MKKTAKAQPNVTSARARSLATGVNTLQVLKRRCAALNVRGEPCQSPAMIGRNKCCMHTGDHAKVLGARGGRRRAVYDLKELTPLPAPRTAEDVIRLVSETIHDLRTGKIDARLSNSICYAIGPLLNAIEVHDLGAKLDRAERGLPITPQADADRIEDDEEATQ